MRSLTKLQKPQILADHETDWLAEYKADRTNKTKKYRYRDRDIKKTLKTETGDKCVYCESKIGHNTPGDVEHKIPSSKNIDLHFTWGNLTIACGECNRRKNNYYEQGEEFLDPYQDNVEDMIDHNGPICLWATGSTRAEITLRILELNSSNRIDLIARKIEKIEALQNLCERYHKETHSMLKAVLLKQLENMAQKMSEYSGMVLDMLRKKGILNPDKDNQAA